MKSVSLTKLSLLFLLFPLLFSSCSSTIIEKHSVHNGLYYNCSLCTHSIETKNLNSIEHENANYELEASTNDDVVQIIIQEHKSFFKSIENKSINDLKVKYDENFASNYSKNNLSIRSQEKTFNSINDEKPIKEAKHTGLGMAFLALFLGLTTPLAGLASLVTAPAGLALSIFALRRSRKRSFARFIAIFAMLINAFVTFLWLMFMFAF